ncbi:MAG: tRNA epoxyqueuosine(34) reductase QueG [Muribaculaceae bacterium]
MSLKASQCTCEQAIKQQAASLGFDACGIAHAQPVSDVAARRYERWLQQGRHDCMTYAERYADVRNNPQLLLPGAQSVISVALGYFPAVVQPPEALQIAYYAYGTDYHEVMRQRLTALALYIKQNWDAECRVCVDTAPIREKYWAQQAGIGFVGRNNLLILPGRGSYFFLGEVVTTLALTPDAPCTIECGNCHRCVDACPGGALSDQGEALNAARCLSCQLIERRGELPDWVLQAKGSRLYGCDECQKVCPHNANAVPTQVPEFAPRQAILTLTPSQVKNLEQPQFSEIFAHSAIKRIKLQGLKRNLGHSADE